MATVDADRTEDPGALGAHVRRARLRRATSLRALAEAVGVSPATISQIEHGRTALSAVRLARIAEALGTTVADILEPAEPERAAAPASPAARTPTTRGEPTGGPTAPARADEQHIRQWRTYEALDFDPVLRAALDEILAIGYHGATVRSIAARSGLSVPGLYHHYASKQQMLLSILERTMGELLARGRAARAEGRDPVERFGFLIEHLALFHTHRRELGFVGASEMRGLDDPGRRAIAAMRTTQQRMVDEEVEAAVRQGDFRDDHPLEAARATVTMCTALAHWWRPDGPFTAEETAQQYVGFALALMSRCP
ncbi:TetR family transcriptional regulator [Bounagaea algeriensis]